MRAWTVMVYMAGDAGAYFSGPIGDRQLLADLSRPLQADLAKIAAAGSTEQVAICVQFDSLRDQQAFRWIVPAAGAAVDPPDAGPQGIGSVNTGEPASLSDFIGWAGQRCPAEHYALIIWGHGSGWSEDQIYSRFPPPAGVATRDDAPARQTMLRRGIFASTAGKLLGIRDAKTRALCYDDSARDFLDNRELRAALAAGAAALGRPRIDALGLDACLMTMLEVAHEIRGQAAYLVGSETVLPQALWPWQQLLGQLQARPDLGPRDVARLMGGHLPAAADGTRGFVDVCQAVLDLDRAATATAAVDDWSQAALALLDRDAALMQAFAAALADDGALRLAVPRGPQTDYVDLHDLLRVVIETWDLTRLDAFMDAGEAAGTAPQAVFRRATHRALTAIGPEGGESIVIGRKTDGFRARPAPGGLSIYLPLAAGEDGGPRELSPQYGNLEFSDTAWPELVCRLRERELPAAFAEFRRERARTAGAGS